MIHDDVPQLHPFLLALLHQRRSIAAVSVCGGVGAAGLADHQAVGRFLVVGLMRELDAQRFLSVVDAGIVLAAPLQRLLQLRARL